MIDATSDTAKKHIGWLAYAAGAAQHLRDRPMRTRITLDERPTFTRRPRTVIVGNVKQLQAGMRLLDNARPDDGLLDVAILSPRTLRHWLSLGWGVLRRKDTVARIEFGSSRSRVAGCARARRIGGPHVDRRHCHSQE